MAPTGTVVVILVAVDRVTIAIVLLNFIMLLVGVVLKFVPVMVTMASTAPLIGVKLSMVGVGKTVKSDELVPVTPPTVTVIVPDDAPAGTVVVILVEVDAETVAVTPLNFTILFDGVLLK